ncbi:hypothetical protein EBH_0063320 [Eimeria brunetti]|uniref:Transporter, major facilitator family domain containing protein n=1 Tax=Eimeria brunetti TaxID=51314 RepID=U6L9X2_9EIME|nr:hypothetical protein EBH_0063320 [Eimeria brunetti]
MQELKLQAQKTQEADELQQQPPASPQKQQQQQQQQLQHPQRQSKEDAAGGSVFAKLNRLLGLRLCPAAASHSAQQQTPFGLNRHLILFVYVVYVFLTGCVYFGWAAISSMLLRADSFSHLCPRTADGSSFVEDLREEKGYICNEQEAAVQHLYTLTLAVHTTFSSIAGTTMDFAGPLATAALGQLFNFTGWALLASSMGSSSSSSSSSSSISSSVSSSSSNSGYLYAGFVFIGMGADMGFLPTLCITRLFPKSAGLSITLLGSAASASFAIPLILECIYTSLSLQTPKNVFWAYACQRQQLILLVVQQWRFQFPEEGQEQQQQVQQREETAAAAASAAAANAAAGRLCV